MKWTFDAGTAPRGELIDQLKVQCQAAFGPKFLEFFHKTDGPSQTKAIGLLENEDLEKLKSVVDLILRWSTVRFSEKNTTVLTRLLIWLQKLFNQLNEVDYRMLAFEATAFLPHLISKLGEGRQEVRDSVHDMLRKGFIDSHGYYEGLIDIVCGLGSVEMTFIYPLQDQWFSFIRTKKYLKKFSKV